MLEYLCYILQWACTLQFSVFQDCISSQRVHLESSCIHQWNMTGSEIWTNYNIMPYKIYCHLHANYFKIYVFKDGSQALRNIMYIALPQFWLSVFLSISNVEQVWEGKVKGCGEGVWQSDSAEWWRCSRRLLNPLSILAVVGKDSVSWRPRKTYHSRSP